MFCQDWKSRMSHITGKVYDLTQANMQKLIQELEQSHSENQALRKIVEELMNGLDIATDLLPVAEHMQDDEWYEKEKQVYEIFKRNKSELEKLKPKDGE